VSEQLSPAQLNALIDRNFAPIFADAARSTKQASLWISIMGQWLLPWLSAPGMQIVSEMIFGKLLGRHVAKQVAYEIQKLSDDLARDNVFIQTKPFESRVVGGSLPLGTTTPALVSHKKIKIGPMRIAEPLVMRLVFPPQPWRYKTKQAALSVGQVQRHPVRYNPGQRGF